MSALDDQLTAIHTASAGGRLPAEVFATFKAREDALAAAGAPTVAPGTEVPDLPVVTATGEPATLAGVLDGAPAVLVFYRGGWCPYCNLTLRTYQSELLPQLSALGVALVAVSPQRPDGSLSTQEAAELTFAVISDPANGIADALGIVDAGTDEVRAAQGTLGLDLARVNAEGDVRLPMPAVVVVDADRRVRWADVHPVYTTRTDVGAIVDAARGL